MKNTIIIKQLLEHRFSDNEQSDHRAFARIVDVVTAVIIDPSGIAVEDFFWSLKHFYGDAFSALHGNIIYFAEVCFNNLDGTKYTAAEAIDEKYESTLSNLSVWDFDAAVDFTMKCIYREIEEMGLEERVALLQSCSNDWKSKLNTERYNQLEKFLS